MDRHVTTVTKIDIALRQFPPCIRASRQDPASEHRCQPQALLDQRLPRKRSAHARDRLRLSEALGLGNNGHSESGGALSTGLPWHGHSTGLCWIVVDRVRHGSRWTTTDPRRGTSRQTEGKHERRSREGSSSLFGSGGDGLPST